MYDKPNTNLIPHLQMSMRCYKYWPLFDLRIQLFAMAFLINPNQKQLLLTFLLLLLGLVVQISSQLLDPTLIQSLMFTEEITGIPKVAIPTSTIVQADGKVGEEKYTISMEKASQKMLPGNYPNTTLYVYSAMTSSGKVGEYPGPAIMAKKNMPVKIVWVNNITGRHMLPVDYSHPFIDDPLFRSEVPVVPHVHGLVTTAVSDGLPRHYWTFSGGKSSTYQTEEPCNKNEAVYKYPNEQDPGLFWYHDHTYGITRLNVYAGLAGFYQIVEQSFVSGPEKAIHQQFGQNLTKLYFSIADKSFHTNGSLFYPDASPSSSFTTWVPQFYGNTMTVNGKVWPKVKLDKKVYRMIFLNACQARYLNIFFLYLGQKLPFQLIRLEGDFFPITVMATEYLLSPSARLEIVIDLSKVFGEVLLKNTAPAPHPNGDPMNLVDKFTGTIMKITTNQPAIDKSMVKSGFLKVRAQGQPRVDSLTSIKLKEAISYPAFDQGQRVFEVLNQVEGPDMQVAGMFIGGASMQVGQNCTKATYQLGKVYDFEIVNLTPDTHPVHFHLVNFQKIMTYPINVNDYLVDWYNANGGEPPITGYDKVPITLDPMLYKSGSAVMPQPHEKVFRDVIDAPPDMVTVIRVKFSHNDGHPFGVKVAGGRFVWHCHMLEHEDNEMMKYFCLK